MEYVQSTLIIPLNVCLSQVVFAGYTIPHPSEDIMHLRIQTLEGYPAQVGGVRGEVGRIIKYDFLSVVHFSFFKHFL